jgi:hypothetical protein
VQLRWQTLVHHGVLFPPEYEPHGVKLLYDGVPVDLTPEQEEVATFFAVMKDTGESGRRGWGWEGSHAVHEVYVFRRYVDGHSVFFCAAAPLSNAAASNAPSAVDPACRNEMS